MSERMQPNPEQEPMKKVLDNCSGCGEQYLLDKNTVDRAFWFSDSPRHSFAQCKCPNCNYRTIIFIDDFGREALGMHGVKVNEKLNMPPKDVIETRAKVDAQNAEQGQTEQEPEYTELPTYELTDRLESEVERFSRNLGSVLANAPEHFWDEMNEQNPQKPYPQRWIEADGEA